MYWFEVMACSGVAVCEAWCVSSRGGGDGIRLCGGVPVRWVLGDWCRVSVAMGVGASVGPSGKVHVMAWYDMSECGVQCVACRVGCDGVQLRGGGGACRDVVFVCSHNPRPV